VGGGVYLHLENDDLRYGSLAMFNARFVDNPVDLLLQFMTQFQQVTFYPYPILYGRKVDPIVPGFPLLARTRHQA